MVILKTAAFWIRKRNSTLQLVFCYHFQFTRAQGEDQGEQAKSRAHQIDGSVAPAVIDQPAKRVADDIAQAKKRYANKSVCRTGDLFGQTKIDQSDRTNQSEGKTDRIHYAGSKDYTSGRKEPD